MEITQTNLMNNNTCPSNIQLLPVSFSKYLTKGFHLVPIPAGQKNPTHKGWNLKENTVTESYQLLPNFNYGLAHAYSGTVAIDIDEWDMATEALTLADIDLENLYNASDAVTIESGRPGHGKLLYRMPTGMVLPSKKLIKTVNNVNINYIDFRCATATGNTVQDVLPPSIHPETCQPYKWGGSGSWENLPLIPPALLEFWQSQLETDKTRTIPSGTLIDASWDEIKSALEAINPDSTYEDWVKVGMALHWAGHRSDLKDAAFYVWDEWSSTGQKYKGQRDLVSHWSSFNAENDVTLGTLYHMAQEAGWKRPQPDVRTLFAEVKKEEIDPFAGMVAEPPDIDLSLFPKILVERCEEIADSKGADPIVPLYAGLAVTAGAMNSQSRIRIIDGFVVPPVLWLMTLGKPSDKKTPASSPMFEILRTLEKEDRGPYSKQRLLWEREEAIYNARYKDYIKTATENPDIIPNDIGTLPRPPVPLRIMVKDITSQKLVHHAADRPEGLLCYLDELSNWMTNLNDPRSTENRAAWLEAFESNWYRHERVGTGDLYCENLAISIYGNIQPAILYQNIKRLCMDGLMQRFMPGFLRPKFSYKLGNPIPDIFSSKGKWDGVVRMVHMMPKQIYHFSQDAYKIFRGFEQWDNDLVKEEGILNSDGHFIEALKKLTGLTGRLAGICHVIDNPFSTTIGPETVERVVEIIKGFIVPSLRHLYDVSGLNDSMDMWLHSHILQYSGEKDTITLREIKMSAKRRIGDLNNKDRDRIIEDSMALLEMKQWVKLIDESYNGKTWAINPNVGLQHKQQREVILLLKQKRLDDNWRKTKGKSKRKFVIGYNPEMDKILNAVRMNEED